MKATDYARLVLLAAIWGASFIFMRVGESLPASSLAGGVLILAGTVLVTRG